MRTIAKTTLLSLALAVAIPASAFAHVVVTPKEAAVGARTTFSVSVPNEKDVAVTEVKLAIPNGLKDVTPTVHAGWTITTSANDDKEITEITWSGTIPAGQRDDLTFRAQAPAKPTELIWKATQSYADDTVVAWDQKPTDKESESKDNGPYSVTKITDNADADAAPAGTNTKSNNDSSALPLIISLIALLLSAAALMRKPKPAQPQHDEHTQS